MATERLDLVEGKRLLSEKQRLEGDANALALGEADGVLEAAAAYAHAAFMVWLQDHADLILAAAEEAEKRQPLVDAARTMVREYDEEIAARVARHGNVAGSQYGATRRIEPLRKALAALTPPEPLSAQQATP